MTRGATATRSSGPRRRLRPDTTSPTYHGSVPSARRSSTTTRTCSNGSKPKHILGTRTPRRCPAPDLAAVRTDPYRSGSGSLIRDHVQESSSHAPMNPTTVLTTLSGHDRPGVTAAFFAALAAHDVEIRDVEQVVISERLILAVLFDLHGELTALRTSIGQTADALGMECEVVSDEKC